ncbi:hypothetical protein Tco_0958895 [Tanacetum coccineum]
MATITSIKCVLTQEHLDSVCIKYFVPEEVHPQLPGPDNTMHERPSGKVGMYTRFFDYANYRIPFSNFFVSVLVHFRIPFSQLSVFGSAKVSHFEILCRVCNIEPSVSLFRYFYTHNYKNGWFGFTKRPNVRACYSKNLDSVKNWNDHFFWVDEFVVPANARFSWFSGSNIVKDKAPPTSEYNMEHVNTLIAQASPFLRFPEEFLCWVGISRNYLLKKDTYPRFEYEDGEEMDLNAFIRTADPRKVRIVERPRTENERPIVAAVVEIRKLLPLAVMKKRVTHGSESTPAASHPPKILRADYGKTGGSAAGGKSPSVLNRLLQDSRLMVEHGVPALPTLPFITSSVTASPLEEGGDHTDSVTGPSLRTVGPSARFVVLSDSSHHSGAKSADPKVDSFVSKDRMLTIQSVLLVLVHTDRDKIALVRPFYKEGHVSDFIATKDESMEVAQLRTRVSSLEAIEGLLRGEVNELKLQPWVSVRSGDVVREAMKTTRRNTIDNLMKPLEARLAKIDADCTRDAGGLARLELNMDKSVKMSK